MTDYRYRKDAGGISNLKYYIVWTSKYRRQVLVDEVAVRLAALLKEKAEEQEYIIHRLTIQPDYVFITLEAPHTDAPVRIVSQLKGYTSRMLRREFKHLTTRLPTLWNRHYYIGTIGFVPRIAVARFIEDQKTK